MSVDLKVRDYAATVKDIHVEKDICSQLFQYSASLWNDSYARAAQDLKELDALKEKMAEEEAMRFIEMETLVSVVNVDIRRETLRSRLMSHMTEEREMSNVLQQHKDDFMQFVWKRKVQAKKQLRGLFSNGSGLICRFGDLISAGTMESIELFEQANAVRLCREAVKWNFCESEDLPSYLGKRIALVMPKANNFFVLRPSRLEFTLHAKCPLNTWNSIYANDGPSSFKLANKKFVATIVSQTLDQIIYNSDNFSSSTSFICILARIVDAVHPTHQLQSTILAYPLNAGAILKKKISSLGYSIQPATEDSGTIDAAFCKTVLKQILHNLQTDQRFYFEVTFPDNMTVCVGFISAVHCNGNNHFTFPGETECSFGFWSNGSISQGGKTYAYATTPNSNPHYVTMRTMGIVIDLFTGTIALMLDKKLQSTAFGKGSSIFPQKDQEEQQNIILAHPMIPMIAVQASEPKSEYDTFQNDIHVNFGKTPFTNVVDARPLDNSINPVMIHPVGSKGSGNDGGFILSSGIEARDKAAQEEEERLHLAAEKSNLRSFVYVETLKSFSQFPPSVYRRSLACTKIQRAWRIFRGKRERKRLKQKQYEAATIIQRVARRKLRHLRAKKHEAAFKIQKNWRRCCFIWIALLRCRYQTPIPELHHAAAVIQRKWRSWFMFRNSPIAAKYNAKIEYLETAVNKIIAWWRPLYVVLTLRRKESKKHQAATTIQRVWRGHNLRSILRADIRTKLTTIGAKIAQHRGELIRIRAAYILQKAWRAYIQQKVRAEKIRTRHTAAARLQAFWKGYWVRSHVHLRFSYGEAVFLIAVCKALRHCHFLLKMYRPCGIVCPKSNH